MRYIGREKAGLMGLVMGAVGAMPVGAQSQEGQKAALPTITSCPGAVAAIATCYSEKLGTGAYLLAAMPKDWNGNLILFGHGGPAVVPPTATTSQNDLAKYAFAVKSGYAWIASSYRREGFGVRVAAEDFATARKFLLFPK